jgi:hypothetical protein
VWVDCDCIFREAVSDEVVDGWFGDSSFFYLKSRDRHVIESGVLGLKLRPDGLKIISSTLHRYVSQEFRNDLRWDDESLVSKTAF